MSADLGWSVPGALAFVCPRYGTEVLGGAETVVREMAERLATRGLGIEVLTTCAVDHHTWDNHYDEGVADVNGVTVRRFAIQKGNLKRRDAIGALIGAGHPTTLEQQEVWLNEGFRSAGLFHHLLGSHERFHTIILTPYMFWTTYACAQIAPRKNVLRPCLHDEVFARLEVYSSMFSSARGIAFNSEPEADLAASLYDLPDQWEVIGEGVETGTDVSAARFRQTFGIEGDFLLYVGRREWGKNVDVLASFFARYRARSGRDLKLVLIGRGDVAIPESARDAVIDLGFVSDRDKDDAYAAATVVCQPSLWESFSRLVMEAWLGHTPVLAYGGCEVTAHHVRRARGGLVYQDEMSFNLALDLLLEQPGLAEAMGANGRAYVLERYRWDDVIDRLVDRVSSWAPQERRGVPA